jgi:hypothetical protein
MPHISSSSIDFYTDASWIAFDLRESNEQEETEEMLINDIDLPFVQEDDFNYYPELSPRVHGPSSAVADESPVLGKGEEVKIVRQDETVALTEEKEQRKVGVRRKTMNVIRRLGMGCW